MSYYSPGYNENPYTYGSADASGQPQTAQVPAWWWYYPYAQQQQQTQQAMAYPPAPPARGRGMRGARRPNRGFTNVRGGTGRGGSRTWVNPNIDPARYRTPPAARAAVATQPVASTSSHSSHASHSAGAGRGSANKVLVNKATAVKPTPAPSVSSVQQALTPGSKITIAGVKFTVSKSGTKLIKAPTASSAATPVQVTHAGQVFIRTKSGNLIAKSIIHPTGSDAVPKSLVSGASTKNGARPRSKTTNIPCRFFQKTGECRKARTCRYVHDSSKIAICPLFLRNACDQTEATCALSHTPNDHRMPFCVHFPNCTFGERCMYPHVHTAPDAPVCRDFALYGWCDAGARACGKRHVNECPEFSAKGSCTAGPNCKLPHVLRRKRDPNATEVTMPSLPARGKRAIDKTDEAEPQEQDQSRDTDNDEEADSDVDTARVKRPKHDHLSANTDYITFIEPSDDESGDNGQGDDDDDARSVDSRQFTEDEDRDDVYDGAKNVDHHDHPTGEEEEESEPSSSEDESEQTAAKGRVAVEGDDAVPESEGLDESFITAPRGSSVAPSEDDDFDPDALMYN